MTDRPSSSPSSTTVPGSTPPPSDPWSALDSDNAEMRRLAVESLAMRNDARRPDAIARALDDDDWRVRKEAIGVVRAIAARDAGDARSTDGSDSIDSIDALVAVLVRALLAPSEKIALRNAAVEALSSIGIRAARAVETLLGKTLDGSASEAELLDADARKLVVEVLGGARSTTSIAVLARALDDVDPNVRAASAEAIGAIGASGAGTDDVSAILQRLLDHPDRLLRLTALEGLNQIGAEVAVDVLAAPLGDRILRHAAIVALGRSSDPRAIATLVGVLDDPARHLAESALRALGQLLLDQRDAPPNLQTDWQAIAAVEVPRAGARGRERILEGSRSEDPSARRGALLLFAWVDVAEAVPALVDALADELYADDAERGLIQIGSRALDAIVASASNATPSIRKELLKLLPRMVSTASPTSASKAMASASAAVRAALTDGNAGVVGAAAWALSAMVPFGMTLDAADIRHLVTTAASTEPRVSAIALQSLRSLARAASRDVVDVLLQVDPESAEAHVVCAVLPFATSNPDPSTEASDDATLAQRSWLARAVSSPSARARRLAIDAIVALGGRAGVELLTFAVADESSEVALAAVRALGRLRSFAGGSPGVAPLTQILDAHSSDRGLALAAARALGATEDPEAVATLVARVTDADPAIACAAIESLASLAPPDLMQTLDLALTHPAEAVGLAAIDLFEESRHIARPSAIEAFLHAAAQADVVEVRLRAIDRLVRLLPSSARASVAAAFAGDADPRVPIAYRAAVEAARTSTPAPPLDEPA